MTFMRAAFVSGLEAANRYGAGSVFSSEVVMAWVPWSHDGLGALAAGARCTEMWLQPKLAVVVVAVAAAGREGGGAVNLS